MGLWSKVKNVFVPSNGTELKGYICYQEDTYLCTTAVSW